MKRTMNVYKVVDNEGKLKKYYKTISVEETVSLISAGCTITGPIAVEVIIDDDFLLGNGKVKEA